MPVAALPQIPVVAVTAIITLCGAFVLALLDVWLRRKGVKDQTLIWLTLSLLSWSAGGAAQMLPPAWLNMWGGAEHIPYYLSPVSSVLFTVAAFRLSRVRETFRREDLRAWPLCITLAVVALSVTSLLSLVTRHYAFGKTVDATASCVALTVLAGGLLYSFYKYGNQLLAGLTGVTFTFYIVRQFIGAEHGMLHGSMAALGLAATTIIVMLFIALSVAWGLSESSRLRIVGAPAQVSVVVLFFDLRGSTQWTQNVLHGDYQYAGTFIDQLRTWAWRKASEAVPVRPSLVKFLGDGFLFVWETPQNANAINEYTRSVALLAYALTQEYPAWTSSNMALWKEVPKAIGAGVDVGSAIRVTFENGAEDYLGGPINCAAKMQDAARPSGGVVLRAEVGRKFSQDDAFQQKFARSGEVTLGNGETLAVCATGEVEFSDHYAVAPIFTRSFANPVNPT